MAVLTLSEKLDQLDARYQEMTRELSTPEVISDSARFQKLAKQHAELEEIVAKHRAFKQLEKDLAGARQMIVESEDAEMRHMAQEEEKQLLTRKEETERELKLLLLPRDRNDEKTSSWKSAPARAATRPPSSPAIFSACTRATRNRRDGRWR